MTQFSPLSPAEIERLAILSEELGEAQQVVGKLIRHGAVGVMGPRRWDNWADLERELGDVVFAIRLLAENGPMSARAINGWANAKRNRIDETLHYQHFLPAPLTDATP